MAPIGLNSGLRMAECIAQCLNLEHEFHDTASEHDILGLRAAQVVSHSLTILSNGQKRTITAIGG
jgi:hypothetical protein